MKTLSQLAVIAMLAATVLACDKSGKSDSQPDSDTTAATTRAETTAAATTTENAEEPEEAAGFTPTKIPGTPHDEEGMMITLKWAGEPGEVGLMKSIGVPSKATANVSFEKDAVIAYEDSVVLVTEPTELKPAKDGVSLKAASSFAPESGSLAEASREVPVNEGDTVYMLKYAGEGTCYMGLNDDVYLANCPNDEFEDHERKPVASEWWVLVKGDSGSGWLKVDDRVEVETESSM